jgi:hypothetical protein
MRRRLPLDRANQSGLCAVIAEPRCRTSKPPSNAVHARKRRSRPHRAMAASLAALHRSASVACSAARAASARAASAARAGEASTATIRKATVGSLSDSTRAASCSAAKAEGRAGGGSWRGAGLLHCLPRVECLRWIYSSAVRSQTLKTPSQLSVQTLSVQTPNPRNTPRNASAPSPPPNAAHRPQPLHLGRRFLQGVPARLPRGRALLGALGHLESWSRCGGWAVSVCCVWGAQSRGKPLRSVSAGLLSSQHAVEIHTKLPGLAADPAQGLQETLKTSRRCQQQQQYKRARQQAIPPPHRAKQLAKRPKRRRQRRRRPQAAVDRRGGRRARGGDGGVVGRGRPEGGV